MNLDQATKHLIKIKHIICQSGARSEQACFFLDDQGYKVVNVDGGTSAWPGVLEY